MVGTRRGKAIGAAALAAILLGGCGNIIVPPPAAGSGYPWPPVQADWNAPGLLLRCRGGTYYLNGRPVTLTNWEPNHLEFYDGFNGTVFQVHRGGGSVYRPAGGGPWWAGPSGQWTTW
jgi:hypothetical protein